MAPRRGSGPYVSPPTAIVMAVCILALLVMAFVIGGAFWGVALFLILLIVVMALVLRYVGERQEKKREQHNRQEHMDARGAPEEQRGPDPRFRRRTLGELRSFTPPQFGHYIGGLLEDMGYQQVEYREGGGDLAADLQCLDDDGREIIVRCRRWKPRWPVGSREIQESSVWSTLSLKMIAGCS